MIDKSEQVKLALSQSHIHDRWEKVYRTVENEQFWELMLDSIVENIYLSKDGKLLDIGCGIGQHSIRLANRGFNVTASDFSPSRVEAAKANVAANNLQEKIQVCSEDLTSLSFDTQSFDCILCWGVLMHIPEIEKAMLELIRVVKVGGKIIIYEDNLYSIDTLINRIGVGIKMSLGRSGTKKLMMSPYGLESWVDTDAGEIIIRQSNINSLKNFFEAHKCKLINRTAGQFTELYRLMPNSIVSTLLHFINWFWFSKVKSPFLAYGNLLVFEKEDN